MGKFVTTCLIACAVAVVVCGEAGAFDGHRRGFTIGLGAGFGVLTHFNDHQTGIKETRQSLALELPIGYGWSDTDLLVFLPAPAFFKSDKLCDSQVMQGLWSLRWYHFFRDQHGTPFVSLGAGRAVFSTCCDDIYAAGPGLGAAVGYQFVAHLTVECQYFHGWTTDNGRDFSHDSLSLVVSLWAY